MNRFELEAEDAAIGAVDNIANLIAASAVLRSIKADLESQGLYPALCNNPMDQGMSVSWFSEHALNAFTVWLDEGAAKLSSHHGGKTVFRREFASIEEFRLGYQEALEAMHLAERISRGKQVLNDIQAWLTEHGVTSAIYHLSDDEELCITWDGKDGSVNSVTIDTGDDDAYLSGARAGKVIPGHTFNSIEELADGYMEALEARLLAGAKVIAMEVMDEFKRDYLAPLGIEGVRLSQFWDGDELAVCWYDSNNRLCTVSIWVPELYASVSSFAGGRVWTHRDFDDLDALRAYFPELIRSGESA
jgi:hypothetical protein